MPACIYTKLHQLTDIIDAEDLPLAAEHHYVIDDNLFGLITRKDLQSSIATLIEANLAHLPFPYILVEFNATPEVTRFVWLKEMSDGFTAKTAFLTKQLASIADDDAYVTIKDRTLNVIGCNNENDGNAIALAVAFALLLLNIAGIEKIRITSEALNKAREKKGRSRVPTHVILKIGVVYDRQGNRVKGTGKLCDLRFVPGHIRNQAYGKQWSQHRIIFVAPYIVNYTGEGEIPKFAPRVVKMA